jgi:hypothetical protein
MMTLERKLKIALDEGRLLVLGAQVLFGFQFNGIFQEFPRTNAPALNFFWIFWATRSRQRSARKDSKQRSDRIAPRDCHPDGAMAKATDPAFIRVPHGTPDRVPG